MTAVAFHGSVEQRGPWHRRECDPCDGVTRQIIRQMSENKWVRVIFWSSLFLGQSFLCAGQQYGSSLPYTAWEWMMLILLLGNCHPCLPLLLQIVHETARDLNVLCS